jgi:hypothetical protein
MTPTSAWARFPEWSGPSETTTRMWRSGKMLETADDGVQRATAAGLIARPLVVDREAEIAAVVLGRLAPDSAIALAARVKRSGEEYVGGHRELLLLDTQKDREAPCKRLLGDAMACDGALINREDSVEDAWAVVEPVLAHYQRALAYHPDTWGPNKADELIAPNGLWNNPSRRRTVPLITDAPGAFCQMSSCRSAGDQNFTHTGPGVAVRDSLGRAACSHEAEACPGGNNEDRNNR